MTTEAPGNGTIAYRVTQLEEAVRELRKDMKTEFASLGGEVKSLVIYRASMAPLERLLWILVGAVVAAVGSGLVWAMAQAALASE